MKLATVYKTILKSSTNHELKTTVNIRIKLLGS